MPDRLARRKNSGGTPTPFESFALVRLHDFLGQPNSEEIGFRGFDDRDDKAYWHIVSDQFLAPEGLPQSVGYARRLVSRLIQKGFLRLEPDSDSVLLTPAGLAWLNRPILRKAFMPGTKDPNGWANGYVSPQATYQNIGSQTPIAHDRDGKPIEVESRGIMRIPGYEWHDKSPQFHRIAGGVKKLLEDIGEKAEELDPSFDLADNFSELMLWIETDKPSKAILQDPLKGAQTFSVWFKQHKSAKRVAKLWLSRQASGNGKTITVGDRVKVNGSVPATVVEVTTNFRARSWPYEVRFTTDAGKDYSGRRKSLEYSSPENRNTVYVGPSTLGEDALKESISRRTQVQEKKEERARSGEEILIDMELKKGDIILYRYTDTLRKEVVADVNYHTGKVGIERFDELQKARYYELLNKKRELHEDLSARYDEIFGEGSYSNRRGPSDRSIRWIPASGIVEVVTRAPKG